MAGEADMAPDERALVGQLQSTRFLAGVDEGRWRIVSLDFPMIVVRINACDLDGVHCVSMEFQLVCDDFPAKAPFVQRWDYVNNSRPPAPDGPPGVKDALKDWTHKGKHGGVYRAWQRYASVHNNWAAKRPDEAWRRDRPLVFIMEQLYALVSEQADWLALRSAA